MRAWFAAVAFACLVFAGAAHADAEARDPFGYPVLTYLWVLLLAVFGGVVNFTRKLREGVVRAFNLTEFIGELVTSGFAGLLTFWMCEAAGVNKMLAAVLIGVSGHMGSRAIFRLEKWAEDKVSRGT